MAAKYLSAAALILATTPALAADWHANVGLTYSQDEAYFEGATDDPVEECCGWVADDPDATYQTGGDDHAIGGRIAISATSDAGTFEFGWISFGSQSMWMEGGGEKSTGERRASAFYGAGLWPVASIGGWTAKAMIGVHRNEVRVRVHDEIYGANNDGAPPKRQHNETGIGHVFGVRLVSDRWSIALEQWRELGYSQTTGRMDPTVLGVAYRFPL